MVQRDQTKDQRQRINTFAQSPGPAGRLRCSLRSEVSSGVQSACSLSFSPSFGARRRVGCTKLCCYNGAKHQMARLMAAMLLLYQNMSFCCTLNTEGMALLKFRERVDADPFGVLSDWNKKGDTTPCSWFGVECYDDRVVVLYLRDLSLKGTLPPEIGILTNLKSLILRNNSFHGRIPKEIGELKELEVLDLGYNNFSGPFPFELLTSMSLTTVLIHHNELLEASSPELSQLVLFSDSEVHADDQPEYLCGSRCNSWNTNLVEDVTYRNLMQVGNSYNTQKIDNDEIPHSRSPDDHVLSPPPPSSSSSLKSFTLSSSSSSSSSMISSSSSSSSMTSPPSSSSSPMASPSSPMASPSSSSSSSPMASPSSSSSSPMASPSSSSSSPMASPSSSSSSPMASPSSSSSPMASSSSPLTSPSSSSSTSLKATPSSPRSRSPKESVAPSVSSSAPSSSPSESTPYLPFPFLLPRNQRSPINSLSSPIEPIVCNSGSKTHVFIILGVIGCTLFLLLSAVRLILFRRSKVVIMKSWNPGLNGKLRKAFVKGIPKLKRQELEAACEDFSNIIGLFFDETVYKGTLSTGTEIAVVSASSTRGEAWTNSSEARFRKKIQRLSKVSHKNFVNLIGYCEESQPFTRMMVFEYAPNGTLFEHLHVPDAEPLNWGMRVRIAMGIAYCLEHLHSSAPPMVAQNLHSSYVYLTEDYAAKISYFSTWNEETLTKMTSPASDSQSPTTASNIYSFGVILLEIITGRIPCLEGGEVLADWALVLLDGRHLPAGELGELSLDFFGEDLRQLLDVIRDCVNPDPSLRPKMREITARLKQLTAISPEAASPRLSPLWWAELEILSTEAS